METMQEIAIYIHKFHNLDLFQQGWYQIKITMRWEDSQHGPPGTPAKVVQYEAPDLCPDDIHGIWRINDVDNSFSTQPFRIKYTRQDVMLSIMVAFNFSLSKLEGPPSKSAVLLKFELMYAPITEILSELQPSLDACSAASHEFRIPPKSLLGLHSYCPIHFDAFHSVIIDASVHITLLRATSNKNSNVPRDSRAPRDISRGKFGGWAQVMGHLAPVTKKDIAIIKAFVASKEFLLEELQNLSKAIDCASEFVDFAEKINDANLFNFLVDSTVVENQVPRRGKPRNAIEEKTYQNLDLSDDKLLHSLSKDALLQCFHSLGNQVLFLWTMFLNFHRANRINITEYLRDSWATDRRAEWSIWMVYTKAEMPHHYITSGSDETLPHHKRVSSLWKIGDDPAERAATRAELHRRSIAQMRINNRTIQDMHIFGDPSRIPIVIVERVMNAPQRSITLSSYSTHLDFRDPANLLSGGSFNNERFKAGDSQEGGRILKVVVFVHGFQGHHLDLRLIRNQWLLIDPKIEFLMSEANQDKTTGDFREMGQRLAKEVISFLKRKMDRISRRGGLRGIKLSFVGHSIGNLIIRTALAESIMEPYLRYLYTYLSVSGPHLGYLYSSNSLFNSGLWLLKKLRNTQCIHQLTFTDDPELRRTFLYQLSKLKTLQNFKNIILLSSPQDGYVPYHSARIEFCQASVTDNSKKGKIFVEMLNNCLDQIRSSPTEHRVFMRCDVNFDSTLHGKNLNTFIGRAAHVEFVESDIFARFIMWSFPDLFR